MTIPALRDWHREETYKSLITISVECLKMLALVNGGAAVAVLTFVGNTVGHTQPNTPAHITPALLSFSGGLLAAIIAFIFSYLVQLQLYSEETRLAAGCPTVRRHHWLLWAAILLVFGAAVAFGLGCLLAAHALGI